ncbi:MAG: hypothetical protein A2902_03645 [Elusimicrobia bacterium RIFCSPLOWO2_01_FULL_64_13]|nr:MAG: hypothetical protein A2902_03645 [Elusimicrobia bacterium RIFCSPLOWO2_01_FULL_64_13]
MPSVRDPEVCVTGIGLVTPLADDREGTWRMVREGGTLLFSGTDPVLGPELSPYVRPSPFHHSNGLHPVYPIALRAAREALRDAGLEPLDVPEGRMGCSVSVSKPVFPAGLSAPASPESVHAFIARELGFSGPALNLVAACATGIHSVLLASRWLKEGLCDAALAGSAESSMHPLLVAGFRNMGVLSLFPRPFDRRRDGFILGEGAGVLVLERRSGALSRGAKVRAVLASAAVGSDCSHPTRFFPDGMSVARVISRALARAEIAPGDVGYVNLHGTGTAANDLMETRAVKAAFGKKSYDISCSSTKPATGHLLGAAGSVELGLACLALRDGWVPPTPHLEEPDPECDLDYTALRGRKRSFRAALSLSFGFGGPIGAAVIKAE